MTPSNGTFLFGTIVGTDSLSYRGIATAERENAFVETTTSSTGDSCVMDATELRTGVCGNPHWYPMSDSAMVVVDKRPVGTMLRSRGRPPRRHLMTPVSTPTLTTSLSAAAVRKPLHTLTNNNVRTAAATGGGGGGGDKRVLIFTATGATSKCMSVPMSPAMAAVTASAAQASPSYIGANGGGRSRRAGAGAGAGNGGSSSGVSPPAVYSYSIVNQRLSHIAAFVPPKGNGLAGGATGGGHQPTHIAYRFVFTNAL